jgi:O-Antigen ligase
MALFDALRPERAGVSLASALSALVLAACFAMGPINSKPLGLVWLALVLVAAAQWVRMGRTFQPPRGSLPLMWVVCTALALTLLWASVGHWPQGAWKQMHVEVRMLLAALAAAVFIEAAKRSVNPASVQFYVVSTIRALGAYGLVAFVYAAVVVGFGEGRSSFDTNAVPWAAASGFVGLLLCAAAWQSKLQPQWLGGTDMQWARGGAVCCALSILISGTRSAWFFLPWIAWGLLQSVPLPRVSVRRLAAMLTMLGACVLAWGWFDQADPLRLREAIDDYRRFQLASREGSLDTRWRLWMLSWAEIQTDPWIARGPFSSKALIAQHATAHGLPYLGSMGHFHNDFLTAWYERGPVGFIGFVLPMMCLLGFALRMRQDPISAWIFLAFGTCHGFMSMINTNAAHNYYYMVLSACVALAVLNAALVRRP